MLKGLQENILCSVARLIVVAQDAMQGPEDASGVAANQVLKSASFTLLDSRNQPSIGIVRSSRIGGRTGIRRRRIQIFCTDPRAQCAAQRKIGNGDRKSTRLNSSH